MGQESERDEKSESDMRPRSDMKWYHYVIAWGSIFGAGFIWYKIIYGQ